jgi:hypothetical protein
MATFLGYFFPKFKFWRKKIGWDKFWAIFSLTHLVTLFETATGQGNLNFKKVIWQIWFVDLNLTNWKNLRNENYSGANPTTFEFAATSPALYVVD